MRKLLERLDKAVRGLTAKIKANRKAGKRAPKAKAKRAGARARIKSLRAKIAAQRIDWGGYPPVKGRTLRKGIRIAARYGLVVTSTTGGTHAPGSYHYSGRAVDLASGSSRQMVRAQQAILKEIGAASILELFGPDNAAWVKNGAQIAGAEGSALEQQHDNHIHLAA